MTYMKTEENAQLNKLIEELANDLRPIVQKIENSTKTTQDHYGKYMELLSYLGDDPNHKRLMALALIDAGANLRGVHAAMNIHGIGKG